MNKIIELYFKHTKKIVLILGILLISITFYYLFLQDVDYYIECSNGDNFTLEEYNENWEVELCKETPISTFPNTEPLLPSTLTTTSNPSYIH